MENFFSILGGMGTMATESFVRLLNSRTEAHKDQDYLNYVLFNHASVPDRTDYIMDSTKKNPLPYLLSDIQQQNLLHPEFMVVICNTAHYFYEQLQAATAIEILHMPREAVKEVSNNLSEGSIAVLATEGTVKSGIYQKELIAAGFQAVLPKHDLQKKVNHLIYSDVKENGFINEPLYKEVLNELLTEYNCDGIILGCTELSVIYEVVGDEVGPTFDAQSILVNRVIERARK